MSAPGEGVRLADNLVAFVRALRAAGLPLGPAAMLDAAAALDSVGLRERETVRAALAATLVTKPEHRDVFDLAFALFWRARAEAGTADQPAAADDPTNRPGAARVAAALGLARLQAGADEAEDRDAAGSASDRAFFRRRDFAAMSAEELAEAARLVAGLRFTGDAVRSRRFAPAHAGGAIDPARSLRRSLAGGGAAIELAFRAPRVRLRPVVALCDISGSMAPYAPVVLRVLHAIGASGRKIHVFLFGVRLTNVTRALLARDPDAALAACGREAEDWSGGTRIGASLRAFNRDWSRRVLGQGAIVLLVTDGLERDVGPELAVEADRLRRSAHRLIWLNPLLRFEGFEPRARGVRVLSSAVDEMRPVHDLASVEQLCAALGDAGVSRKPR